MTFTNSFLIYPSNRALERAVEDYEALFPGRAGEPAEPEPGQENFIHTRGNFELHRRDAKFLETAREVLQSSLNETSRERSPREWATAQNSLGNVLAALGQQRDSDEPYAAGIQAFEEALGVYDQGQTPQPWAWSQYGLGATCHALGRRRAESRLLKDAVDAYTRALQVWTRQEAPLEWALTMLQLGGAFHSHGMLLRGNRTLQKSVVAYKNALAGLNAEDSRLELVAAYNNRGAVLHHLAESEENPERMEEALRSYERALDGCMALQMAIHLAVVCRINGATARCVLAEMKKDPAIAREAAEEFEVIIECFHDSCQPRYLSHCEQQLARARSLIEGAGAETAGEKGTG